MARKVQHSGDGGTTTYLLSMADGTHQRVTVPTDYTVTFGKVAPYQNDGAYGGSKNEGWCVRIYKGRNQQRAVFTGVKQLRDTSIKVELYTNDLKKLAKVADLEGNEQWHSVEF